MNYENSLNNQLDMLSSNVARVNKKTVEHKMDIAINKIGNPPRRPRKKDIKKKVQFFIEDD